MAKSSTIRRAFGHLCSCTDPHGRCEEKTEEAEDGIFSPDNNWLVIRETERGKVGVKGILARLKLSGLLRRYS